MNNFKMGIVAAEVLNWQFQLTRNEYADWVNGIRNDSEKIGFHYYFLSEEAQIRELSQ